ncbi:MAG: hypothetical protein ACKN8W_02165 [Actinomycetales bacterium]|jgi:hypothetical protein
MNLRELAFQLSAITLISDAAKEAKDRLRREFAAALDEVGADAAKAMLAGEEIAKVSLIQPKTSAEVLSEKALVEWVRANWDYEIVETVRDSFRKHILESVENVDGHAIYPRTGEVLDFISFNSRDPYIATRFKDGGREALIEAFRVGALSPSEVMAEELLMAVGQ